MVYAHLRLPQAGFDRKIEKLRKQAQRPEHYNGCGAQTHSIRVLPELHQDSLRVPLTVQPTKNNTLSEIGGHDTYSPRRPFVRV
jgi:hypothetical protein